MNRTVLLGMQLNCNKQFEEHGKLINTLAIQKRATGKSAGSHVDVRYWHEHPYLSHASVRTCALLAYTNLIAFTN